MAKSGGEPKKSGNKPKTKPQPTNEITCAGCGKILAPGLTLCVACGTDNGDLDGKIAKAARSPEQAADSIEGQRGLNRSFGFLRISGRGF